MGPLILDPICSIQLVGICIHKIPSPSIVWNVLHMIVVQFQLELGIVKLGQLPSNIMME